MIKKGQFVEVISYENTRQFCGRKSKYEIGDSFVVAEISENSRGHGKILSDDDFNFVHEDDVSWEKELK
ncbi:hypothetical protein [Acinetobacter sp. ABJ_C5_2]|uniref:hypothetical protein n=1 Tax=Acinetobacter sp. ABJ_C5_2 TaxID=3376992 RepID=UPI0037CAE3DC